MTTAAAFAHDLKKCFRISILVAFAATIAAISPRPAHGTQDKTVPPTERELIPGADQMSGAERDAYRRRMQAATTADEKAKIRAEYARTTAAPVPQPLVGDPERGANLHKACFSCHGIERYTRPVTHAMATFTDSVLRASGLSDIPPAPPARFKGSIQSLAALRDGVTRRNDFFSPKMTPQEIEDVVAYLNVTYYKFPQ